MSSMKSSEWVYIGNRGRFRRWPRIRTSASVVLCCRATWRWLVGSRSYRRTLHCPWRRAGALWWSGRCRPWQEQLRPRACRQESSCGGAVGRQGAVGAFGVTRREGEDQDELGEVYPGRAGSSASTCKTRALLALRACTAFVRRNARATKTARRLMQIHRPRLETVSKPLDNLVRTGGKVHNTNLQTCQICSCPQGVCQNARGI